jgi:hypothetical protein
VGLEQGLELIGRRVLRRTRGARGRVARGAARGAGLPAGPSTSPSPGTTRSREPPWLRAPARSAPARSIRLAIVASMSAAALASVAAAQVLVARGDLNSRSQALAKADQFCRVAPGPHCGGPRPRTP